MTVWLNGRQQRGMGRAIEGRREPREALAGLSVWLTRFPRAARRLGLALDPFGEVDTRSLGELAARSVVVQIQLQD